MSTIWKAAWIPYVVGLVFCFVVRGTVGFMVGIYAFGIAGGWFLAPLFYTNYEKRR